MWLIMLLFMLSIVLTGVFVGLAWFRSPRYLWAAAAMSWILASFGYFSIGGLLLILTFVLVGLALAYEARLRRPWQVTLVALAAIGLWALAVASTKRTVLFAPAILMEPVFEAVDRLGPEQSGMRDPCGQSPE